MGKNLMYCAVKGAVMVLYTKVSPDLRSVVNSYNIKQQHCYYTVIMSLFSVINTWDVGRTREKVENH